jgi:hypothetical protein
LAKTLQTAGLPRQDARKQTAAAVLTALGVVYGDIGTSPLYGLKQAVQAGGAPTGGRPVVRVTPVHSRPPVLFLLVALYFRLLR